MGTWIKYIGKDEALAGNKIIIQKKVRAANGREYTFTRDKNLPGGDIREIEEADLAEHLLKNCKSRFRKATEVEVTDAGQADEEGGAQPMGKDAGEESTAGKIIGPGTEAPQAQEGKARKGKSKGKGK